MAERQKDHLWTLISYYCSMEPDFAMFDGVTKMLLCGYEDLHGTACRDTQLCPEFMGYTAWLDLLFDH